MLLSEFDNKDCKKPKRCWLGRHAGSDLKIGIIKPVIFTDGMCDGKWLIFTESELIVEVCHTCWYPLKREWVGQVREEVETYEALLAYEDRMER